MRATHGDTSGALPSLGVMRTSKGGDPAPLVCQLAPQAAGRGVHEPAPARPDVHALDPAAARHLWGFRQGFLGFHKGRPQACAGRPDCPRPETPLLPATCGVL